mmetsp:Transcript_135575/g.421189  ORF Transcript_135575/g.421189 Transcript_135575/m.421189 type:complete len:96 (-) Transcript_135575:107-394(-)|eukprot:CAMPEP_0204587732 /NCGR_PEP_ID=MMETSP0661-20131031/48218_1 /ASSEMBLY_ACC=CAM_ASM_000606 /TAXON_ID=109239 /ORGANISM="Alexandrium margalefi, Strain AMGDE01CS-322" /LENGTH=95 /DNA_ID=CAMNT_0051597481 /DNA_START=74 /DNA_END=361 /DNA_ORIENTATION=+
MTRGNQRDKDREANLKKQAAMAGGHSTIKQADSTAEIMRKKQEAADAKKAAAAASGEADDKKGPSKSEKKAERSMEMAMSGRQGTAKEAAGKRKT